VSPPPHASDGGGGGGGELAELIPFAYQELRRVARQRMAQNAATHTLTPTELVNEALLRLLKQAGRDYNDLDHLISVAALAMHDILVDRARRRAAIKRGGAAVRVALDDDLLVAEPADDMLVFNEACEVLRRRSESHFELVLLRVYAGMTNEEIAARRNQSTRTIERQWKFVKAVLFEHLHPEVVAIDE
jgi:RNA polymerase sigma factor (TIGR02999 family)